MVLKEKGTKELRLAITFEADIQYIIQIIVVRGLTNP